MHRRTPSISSFGEVEHSGASPMRARKMSTGGNRSWSEEEESYLLQTRVQKMPYKHIAQHLNKTELACRLHFHQLSHGSHRRKRNASISSTTSSITTASTNTSPSSQFELPNDLTEEYTPQRHPMTPPRQGSPGGYTGSNNSPAMRTMTVEKSAAQQHQQQQKVLLPRLHPRLITPQSSPEPRAGLRIDTNNVGMNANHSANTASTATASAMANTCTTASSGATLAFHHHGYQPAHNPNAIPHSAHTNHPATANGPSHSRTPSSGPVDTARLRAIYEAHRNSFWAAIAAEYGPDVPAAQLEDIWRQGGSGSPLYPNRNINNNNCNSHPLVGMKMHIPRPPTPPGEGDSPEGTTVLGMQLPLPPFKTSGWEAVNRGLHGEKRESRTTIAALLTEERDPRP